MHILYVTNMYPDKVHPYYGIFVSEQITAIHRKHPITYDVFFIDGRKDKTSYLKSVHAIHRQIEQNHYDLIHVHYGFSGLFLLKKLKKKIPVVITLHGGDIQVEQGKWIQVFFTKHILKHADIAITLNDRMDVIAKQLTKNTVKIPCSVNTDLFKPSDIKKPSGNSHEYTIVFPSDKTRMVKNYPLFAKTVEILQSEYKLICKEVELKNMSREEVTNLYQHADLMLMTSISEGSPQVVKEAMGCNLPIVSTKVGDVDYLLDGVRSSAVASQMDAEELAKKVYLSLNNQIKGIDGREKLFQLGLDDSSVADKIYAIYSALLK